jgi:hypothetical protein
MRPSKKDLGEAFQELLVRIVATIPAEAWDRLAAAFPMDEADKPEFVQKYATKGTINFIAHMAEEWMASHREERHRRFQEDGRDAVRLHDLLACRRRLAPLPRLRGRTPRPSTRFASSLTWGASGQGVRFIRA